MFSFLKQVFGTVLIAEVVYVGTINTYHFEVAKLMLEHGKHVLCEKPLCMNSRDTAELLQVCEPFSSSRSVLSLFFLHLSVTELIISPSKDIFSLI